MLVSDGSVAVKDVNACHNIESIYISLRDTGRRPPVFGPPAVDEER
jgi:hypothetical protein